MTWSKFHGKCIEQQVAYAENVEFSTDDQNVITGIQPTELVLEVCTRYILDN